MDRWTTIDLVPAEPDRALPVGGRRSGQSVVRLRIPCADHGHMGSARVRGGQAALAIVVPRTDDRHPRTDRPDPGNREMLPLRGSDRSGPASSAAFSAASSTPGLSRTTSSTSNSAPDGRSRSAPPAGPVYRAITHSA
ncbi:hypothetical protein AB5J72_03950 [Streptomyces sp. CG1]|uniref:hypothetical protein n=1 Tax=Streptomyces sp. CG1 TaxID=1287523 RepID=UPI0034E19F09